MADPTIDPFGIGVRDTQDWLANILRNYDWSSMVLYLDPNGMAPLTAMLSQAVSERTTDPRYYWLTDALPPQAGAVVSIYEEATLTTEYGAGDDYALGTTVYAVVAEDTAKEFRPGHVALCRDASDITNDLHVQVTSVTLDGATSVIAVKLLEADGTGTNDLSTCDWIQIIGNANAENGAVPDVVTYDPVEVHNFTQIFKTPVGISRTAKQTTFRAGGWNDKVIKALKLHAVEQEKAIFYGHRLSTIGTNGEPLRYMRGLIETFQTLASGNCFNYATNTDFSGLAWKTGGLDWVNASLAELFKWGETEKVGYCGLGALLGINQLAQGNSQFNITSNTDAFGIRVTTWVTPFGVLHLKTHPLFSQNAVDSNRIVILEPKQLKRRYIQNTTKIVDKSTGAQATDGQVDVFLTEIGIQYGNAVTGGIMDNVGIDNTL